MKLTGWTSLLNCRCDGLFSAGTGKSLATREDLLLSTPGSGPRAGQSPRRRLDGQMDSEDVSASLVPAVAVAYNTSHRCRGTAVFFVEIRAALVMALAVSNDNRFCGRMREAWETCTPPG